MHAQRPDQSDHRRPLGVCGLIALASFCTFSRARAEPFIGQFELKTLESTPGGFEFQSQNAWSRGRPARRIASVADGIEFDENAVVGGRHALELEMGFTNRLKMRLGVEFERERLDEPESLEQANDFDGLSLTEVGAEIIAVLAPRDGDGAGFGVVAEIEAPVEQEESKHLTLGGIVEFQSGCWSAAGVPMLVRAFGGGQGEKSDNKWDFAYAAHLMYAFSERWSLALEGYGTVERIGSTGHPSQSAQLFGDFDQHRAGPVLYYTHRSEVSRREQMISGPDSGAGAAGASLTIGLGLLEGLNENTAAHTLKLSIEVEF